MARTGRFMSGAQKREWAKEYDAKKKAGVEVRRRGGMEFVQDDLGAWYQRNGDACPGKGWDHQAPPLLDGSVHPRYGKPPATKSNPKGKKTRSPWPWELK